jgi:hypothetical protein
LFFYLLIRSLLCKRRGKNVEMYGIKTSTLVLATPPRSAHSGQARTMTSLDASRSRYWCVCIADADISRNLASWSRSYHLKIEQLFISLTLFLCLPICTQPMTRVKLMASRHVRPAHMHHRCSWASDDRVRMTCLQIIVARLPWHEILHSYTLFLAAERLCVQGRWWWRL